MLRIVTHVSTEPLADAEYGPYLFLMVDDDAEAKVTQALRAHIEEKQLQDADEFAHDGNIESFLLELRKLPYVHQAEIGQWFYPFED